MICPPHMSMTDRSWRSPMTSRLPTKDMKQTVSKAGAEGSHHYQGVVRD